jgi:glycosyltransferase involved in cell wall biosynthesis
MVSIIIPIYNKAEFVVECLQSVFNQTYLDFEIIVVNDGSTDGSERVAAQYPVKILNISNRGIAGARNAGVMNSSGEFILPLDADDWIDPQYLSKTVPQMAPGIGIVSTDMQRFGLQDSYVPAEYRTAYQQIDYNLIPVCSLVRREAFLQTGGYVSKVDGYADWNMWIDILKRGWRMAVVNEPLFHYRFLGDAANFEADQKREELTGLIRSFHPELCKPA